MKRKELVKEEVLSSSEKMIVERDKGYWHQLFHFLSFILIIIVFFYIVENADWWVMLSILLVLLWGFVGWNYIKHLGED